MDLLKLSSLEIRQICYFLMVVECDNSFSRAAERLHIEQPPLSQRIKALEKKLKVTLFDRRKRPVHLTPAGKVFLTEATRAMEQIEQALAQAKRAAQGDIGHLTIGLASSAANSVFPDLLRRFRDRYPQVTYTFNELTAEAQIEAIATGQLDIGFEVISPLQLDNRGLHWQVVAEETLVLALPEDHPLASQNAVELVALAEEPLIVPNVQAFPFYQAFVEACETVGFQPQLVDATWMLTILSLVAAGVGLAILPSNVLNLHRKGVVYREISGLDLTRKMLAVWRADYNSATLKGFLELLADA